MRDAMAGISWISNKKRELLEGEQPSCVIVWGTSIGAGVATGLVANEKACPANLRVVSLCLETPFTSVRDMLAALYPQKWLPYKHLWPFLWNHLDSYESLRNIADNCRGKGQPCPRVFLLRAADDEIVPAELVAKLYQRCVELDIPVQTQAVIGAFHNDATWKAAGKEAIASAIVEHTRYALGHKP